MAAKALAIAVTPQWTASRTSKRNAVPVSTAA